MQKKPSNTREQCAFDRGQSMGRYNKKYDEKGSDKSANPHKKGSVEHQFWNEGFDSV